MRNPETSLVFGVFKGMGDLLSAAPVIHQELKAGRAVHLLLFPSVILFEFCRLLDFSPHGKDLHLHAVPEGIRIPSWVGFLAEMRRIDPDTVWVSPHAPAADSSWKIPLVLRFAQLIFWRSARLVGADSERLSYLFHHRLRVDRRLPLKQREWSAYRLFRGVQVPEEAPRIRFLPEIAGLRDAPPLFDLIIHPGANAQNRTWPFYKYAQLVAALPAHWSIAFVGLPRDMDLLKSTMPAARSVEFVTGTIRRSIETLASATMLLIMDSGNMHFAQTLGVPAVAVFGYTNPASIIDLGGCVDAIYEPRFPCQPCNKAVCGQPEIYCLNAIEPRVVADRLKAQWNRIHRYGRSATELVQISAKASATADLASLESQPSA